MEAITLSHVRIPSINIGGICLPGIGAPGSIGKKGLIWPTGMKEHIKAWYDPKKQGLTNYDVIEAYVEDFTNWNYVKARGVATISQHKFIITECILKGLSIVEDIQEPYSNLTVRIIGITDNQEVLITDYVNGQHQIINTITEDGIYTIEDRHHFVGFGCNFVGTCNITIEQLPTSILKDLSGNGNHAYLYGGKGKLNSGMGVYQEDFTTWSKIQGIYELGANSFNWKYSNDTNTTILTKGANETKSMKVIIEGLSTNILQYAYYEESVRKILEIKQDGEYVLPFSESNSSQTWNGFAIIKNEETVDITITQIPDYPDQLCYDGKMYAVCYGFPILTDYTVMADRTWFDKTGVKYFLSKYKENESVPAQLFKFEWIVNGKEYSTSLGRDVEVVFPNEITWQTKTSYNGKGLPNSTYEDGDLLLIGKVWLNSTNYFIGCHGAIIIADHSFTEEEINWLKQNWDKI